MGVLKGEPAGDTSRLALRLEGKGVTEKHMQTNKITDSWGENS